MLPKVCTIFPDLPHQPRDSLARVTASLLRHGLAQGPVQTLQLGVVAELLDNNRDISTFPEPMEYILDID